VTYLNKKYLPQVEKGMMSLEEVRFNLPGVLSSTIDQAFAACEQKRLELLFSIAGTFERRICN
jgi:hypothetical protein